MLLPQALRVNTLSIGMRLVDGGTRGNTMRDVPEESLMLTGDENIVDVDFTVLWRIKPESGAIGAYLFNIQNPEVTVKAVAESAMREVIGGSDIQPILTGARTTNEAAVQELMQKTLDSYKSGILIQQVQMQKVDPPAQVIDAFRDVQAARADQERLQNEAQTYANRVVPEAKGRSAQIIQSAEAYREQTVAEAQGQTSRFLSVYEEYKKAPDVTRQRIYLETMEKVLGGADKIISDSSSSQGVVPYLPLPNYRRPTQPPSPCSSRSDPEPALQSPDTAKWSQPMKTGVSGVVALVIVVAALVAAYSSLFTVRQTDQALVVRFGKPVDVVTDPGLHYKWPFIDSVIHIRQSDS